jgi:hypothetical protein
METNLTFFLRNKKNKKLSVSVLHVFNEKSSTQTLTIHNQAMKLIF